MSKALIVCAVLLAGAAGGAAWMAWPAPKAGCREPGPECSSPASPCCGDEGAKCCADEAPASVSADAPPTAGVTVIAVEDVDCPSCAKKVVARLSGVAGVAWAVADTKESKVSVTPKGKAAPSARALWEAVEEAGYTPTRLEGPGGAFTALPKE